MKIRNKLPEKKLRVNLSSLVRIGNKEIKIALRYRNKGYPSLGKFIEAAINEKHERELSKN